VKLIIQIPCYNEEQALAVTLAELPREIPGIETVEWLVVDDGSTDRTVAVAQAFGVTHIVRHPANLGLAKAFTTGLAACLERGADIIVNTDADNQYHAGDIGKLIAPILAGRAEIAIGARPIATIEHFSPVKKLLQRFGSWVVRKFSGLDVDDAPSGFRAYSRSAALRMNVFNRYTYTLETIIQAGQSGMAVESVPIRVNAELRPSRLVKSIPSYVGRSLVTILRIFITYRPLRTFLAVGAVFFAAAVALGVRYLFYVGAGEGKGHVQSLILAAILALMGFQSWVLGIVADIISVNRRLLEDIQHHIRDQSTGQGSRAVPARLAALDPQRPAGPAA
jgi:glycosyltransferase involved in cell wall biosynthesis